LAPLLDFIFNDFKTLFAVTVFPTVDLIPTALLPALLPVEELPPVVVLPPDGVPELGADGAGVC
jgi:hypothetical protein